MSGIKGRRHTTPKKRKKPAEIKALEKRLFQCACNLILPAIESGKLLILTIELIHSSIKASGTVSDL